MRKLPNIFTILLPAGMICLLLVVLFSGGDGLCQEGPGPEGVESIQDVAGEPYSYQTEGRPDPFRPFITARATAPAGMNPDEIVDEETELTGMQLFEPGQLTLVGVLTSASGPVAMVEDQTKKGICSNWEPRSANGAWWRRSTSSRWWSWKPPAHVQEKRSPARSS
jgi:type IV pilus assembly protein PilP